MGSRYLASSEKALELEGLEDDFVTCDICDEPIETDDGFRVSGAGVYVETRGGDVRFDEAPICASCSTGIGVYVFHQAMAREEEG